MSRLGDGSVGSAQTSLAIADVIPWRHYTLGREWLVTNVVAEASNTIEWLGTTPSIALPVYQREYRWRQGSCEQLLRDVLGVAGAREDRTHFIGSILATPEEAGGVTLVDGQQRVTTIMLMLAAIRAHAAEHDRAVARTIEAITLGADPARSPRLLTHARYREVMSILMTSGQPPTAATVVSPLEENFIYFYDRLVDDWESAWEGLQRLEHVTIRLGPNASAQQIFESLNSTGAALSDDELIHNYIHMGRNHEEQLVLELETWACIEKEVGGEELRAFWRDYLVLTSSSQPDFTGEFGVYRAFRRRYPNPNMELTKDVQAEWRRMAAHYSVLLRPDDEPEPDVSEQLDLLRAFEGAPRPLLLGLYSEYADNSRDKRELVETLELIQSLFMRRTLVGLPRDIGLAGSLCREMRSDRRNLRSGLIRRTPEDPAVRLALTHSALPIAGYVLRRLQQPETDSRLQIEHIYPQTPPADWSGGGLKWGELSNDDQAQYRTLLNTIGNLTLLEADLNAGASNRSFQQKRDYYRRSNVVDTRAMANLDTWDATNIKNRTEKLIKCFVATWPRPEDEPMDEQDELTRVVDLVVPHTSNADPDRFEYAVFRDDLWGDVHNIKTLHWRIAQTLDRFDSARLRSTQFGSHIVLGKAPRHVGPLDDGSYVYQGWWPSYLLPVAQDWITAFELDDEVKVKLVEVVEPTYGPPTG